MARKLFLREVNLNKMPSSKTFDKVNKEIKASILSLYEDEKTVSNFRKSDIS